MRQRQARRKAERCRLHCRLLTPARLQNGPGSSLHGCNICGKEGHQAALCAVGTVDWGNKWGKDAFWPDKPHVYEEPDYKAIALKVRESLV